MKKRFRDIIGEVSYEDLIKIRADLNSGAVHIRKLLDDTIKEAEYNKIKSCATCGTEINRIYMDDFVLEFGRRDFKKRAFFCGQDCLKFFLNHMEQKKQKIEVPNP